MKNVGRTDKIITLIRLMMHLHVTKDKIIEQNSVNHIVNIGEKGEGGIK